jgi:FkbM family methyltransferase
MKSSNPFFWTDQDGRLLCRNLEIEYEVVSADVFAAYRSQKIDEPVVIFYEIYKNEGLGLVNDCIYQINECKIDQEDVVLDLGGNIGIFSRFASEVGASKIFTFEPVQENFKLLSLNRPTNCEIHRLAVTDVDNQGVKISYKDWAPGGSSINYPEGGSEQTVMTISLDTLINNKVIQIPNFMKIDVEGSEVMVFSGISDDNLSKISKISMELHKKVIGDSGVNYIYDRLHSLGFRSFTIYSPTQDDQVYFWKK